MANDKARKRVKAQKLLAIRKVFSSKQVLMNLKL